MKSSPNEETPRFEGVESFTSVTPMGKQQQPTTITAANLSAEPNTVAMLSTLVDSLTRMHRVSDANQAFAAELDLKLKLAEEASATRATMQAAWEKDFEDKITRQFEAAVARAVSRRSAEYETKLRELESKLEQLESLTLAEVGSRYFSASLSFAWRGSVLMYSGLSLLVAPCSRSLPAVRKRLFMCCSSSGSTKSSSGSTKSSSNNKNTVIQTKGTSKVPSKTSGPPPSFEQQYHNHQQQQHISHIPRTTATASSSSVPDDITSPAVLSYMASMSGKSSNSASLGRHGQVKPIHHQIPTSWKTEEGSVHGTISTLQSQSTAMQDAESASSRHPPKQETHSESSFHTITDREKSANAPPSGSGSDADGGSKHTTPPSLSFSPSPVLSEVHVQQYQPHDQVLRRQPVQNQPLSSVIAAAPVARRRPQRPT